MKVCSLCQREFEDQFQFCTRDGTKLTRIQERGYCRRCGKDYPQSLSKCPLHGTPLTEHGPRTILGDNFCHLCDSDFPKAFKLCPVHGIALQTSPLKKKLRNKIDATDAPNPIIGDTPPPNTNPLPRVSLGEGYGVDARRSSILGTADLPKTDALVVPEGLKANSETDSKIPGEQSFKPVSVHTNGFVTGNLVVPKQIEPEPLQFDNLPDSEPLDSGDLKSRVKAEVKVDDDEGSLFSRINRRHVISAITVALALIVSVSAYNAYVRHSAEESIRFSEPGAQAASQSPATNQAKDKAITDSAADQVKPPAKSAQPNDAAVAAANVAAVTKQTKNAPVVANTPQPEPRHTQKPGNNDQPDAESIAQSDKTRPIFIPKAKDNSTPVQSQQDVKPDNAQKDKKPAVRDVFEQVTPARPGSARVVPSIRNRRRIAVPGGFHYYFEVVLNELNGVGVNWEPATIEQISLGGNAGTRSVGYDFAIGAHGHYVIRVEVDMMGSTSKDWKGTVIYRNKGKDENGHQISISYRIPLDENFRD